MNMNLEEKKEYIKFRKDLLKQSDDSLLAVAKLCIDEMNKRRIDLMGFI